MLKNCFSFFTIQISIISKYFSYGITYSIVVTKGSCMVIIYFKTSLYTIINKNVNFSYTGIK